MAEFTDKITAQGNPLTLVGDEIKVGDKAPECVGVDNDMNPVKLSSFAGKAVILSFVPSLDTATCDIETRRFNQEAQKLGDDVAVVTVSMDLPFAQKRWCGAAGVDNVTTLSDHKDACFGERFGMLIKELRLLARVVFVIDKEGVVRFIHLVKELGDEPDYNAVLDAVKAQN